jgi:hypothetical protein
MRRTLERLPEVLEMPGLRLTVAQAQRLCGVEPALCQAILDALVDAKVLCVKSDGAYARLTDGAESPRPHPVKADLRPERATILAVIGSRRPCRLSARAYPK